MTGVEAAEALGLTQNQFRHRRRLGLLPPPDTPIGGVTYYSQKWLKRAKAIMEKLRKGEQ